jgi:hypothetical protein
MTWKSVELLIRELDPTPMQAVNLSDLISTIRQGRSPTEVTKNGYDDAISLHWDGYEVATYDDHFETYQFSEGHTTIQHWPQAPGSVIDAKLLRETLTAMS